MTISGIPICRSGGLARTVATLLRLVSVLALGACTTTTQVASDYDQSAPLCGLQRLDSCSTVC